MTKPTPEGRAPELVFHPSFLEDLRHWVETDPRVALRVLSLVDAVRRDSTSGIGKPERLRHLAPGAWSRRITQEHRLVYVVQPGRVVFVQARYHY